MFFDIILLNRQHKGELGKAWTASTLGIKHLKKDKLLEVNIIKLCERLRVFITSDSGSAKKRFSLKLSAILLNGTIKIFREHVMILQAEIFVALRTIQVPSGYDEKRIAKRHQVSVPGLETPPTPVAKTKSKARTKKIVETPITPVEELHIQFPNVDNLLHPTAPSENITLRDEYTTRPEIVDEFPLGTASAREIEEFESFILGQRRPEPVLPLILSPATILPRQTIEVVAQVHAPKGDYLERETTTRRVTETPAVEIPSGVQEPPPTESVAVTPTETISVVGEIQVEAIFVAPSEEPVEVQAKEPSERRVLREIQLVQSTQRHVQVSKEIGEAKKQKEKRVLQDDVWTLKFIKKSVVRIDSSVPFGKEFKYIPTRKWSSFVATSTADLYSDFWHTEDLEVVPQIRTTRSKSSSLKDSVSGIRPPGSVSGKRSTLERDMTPLSAPSSIRETPELGEKRHGSISTEGTPLLTLTSPMRRRQVPLEDVSVLLPSPRKRRATDIESISVQAVESVQVPLEEVVIPQPKSEIVPPAEEVPTITDQPTLPDTTLVETHVATEAENRKRPPKTWEVNDGKNAYKIRQQNIINIIAAWNFELNRLTVEDICEKPINKLNMARAFSDLLFLCSQKFIILNTGDDSLELTTITKGPRFPQ